jgi:hypothetical protein
MKRDLHDGETLWRYSQESADGARWQAVAMESNGGSFSSLHRWGNGVMPDWLEVALSAAKVGGCMAAIPKPPPYKVLWFITDSNDNVVEFLQFPLDED